MRLTPFVPSAKRVFWHFDGQVQNFLLTPNFLFENSITYIPYHYIDKKWLNRPLYAEDKESLSKEVILVDDRGRRYKRPNIRKSLLYSDFKITDKRDKDGRRYSIIER